MRAVLAAALAAALASCSPPFDFRLDPSFDDEAAEAIVQAAREWNAITNADHQITFDGDSWYVAKEVPPRGNWAGLTRRHERRIWIQPLPAGGSYHLIAKHELGHALGLRHLCASPNTLGDVIEDAPACDSQLSFGVMDPLQSSIGFSSADLQECKAVGACD